MTEDKNQQMQLRTGNDQQLETMGGRIRAVRKAKKLRLGVAAQKIGLSRTSFTNWEADVVTNPDTGKLRRFSSLVDVSLDWLIDRKGDDPEFLNVPSPPTKRAAKTAPQSDSASKSVSDIAEIAAPLSAHGRGIDLTPRHVWSIPTDVLELGFNCNVETTVVKRIVTRDGQDFGLGRGDYVLIDVSRTRIDEPGIYLVADPDGHSARRVLVTIDNDELRITIMADDTERSSPRDNGENLQVLGRVMGVFKPA